VTLSPRALVRQFRERRAARRAFNQRLDKLVDERRRLGYRVGGPAFDRLVEQARNPDAEEDPRR